MKTIVALLFLVFPVFVYAAVYPSQYKINYHRISLTVNPAVSGAISNGSVTTYFSTTAASVSQIGFDFNSSMTVNSIVYHGSTLGTYVFSSNIVVINFPLPLSPAGMLDSVTINFSGTPVTPSTSIPSGYNYVGGSIYTLGEAFTGSTWWPCKDSLTDKIDSVDLIITTPVAYRAGSNGTVTETVAGPNRICTWKSRHPIAAYLVNFAVADYVNYQFTATSLSHTVPVLNYLHAADNTATYQSELSIIQSAMPVYATLLNTDYPFYDEKYGTAEAGNGWGALEVQSMTFIDKTQYGGNGYTLAHELAHQWFGDKLTTNDWHQIWLNEGFAQYFQQVIYPENLLGAATASSQHASLKNSVNNTSTTYVPNISNADNIFFGTTVSQPYEKGAMTLSMLRAWLGDARFFSALHNYLNAPGLSYNFTSTDSLQYYMQAQTPNNLSGFFPAWINQPGTVTYAVNYQYVPGGAYIQLIQSPTVTGAGHFDMPVPIELKNAGGLDTTIMLIDRGGKLYNSVNGTGYNSNTFYVGLSAMPTIAPILDPNNNVLATASSVTSSSTLSTFITLPLQEINLMLRTDGQSVKIDWKINSDELLATVGIQKSSNGQAFANITETNVKNGRNEYTGHYTDQNAGEGAMFYRLKITTSTGIVKYSAIQTISQPMSGQLTITPNPAKNTFTVHPPALASPGEQLVLQVFNEAGILIYENTFTANDSMQIPCSQFAAGVYQLILKSKHGQQWQTRLIKQ